MGVYSSALILAVRPSHCPQITDKQRKPAHAKRYYTYRTHPDAIIKKNYSIERSAYNTPTQTLQLHYTCDLDSKLRSLTAQIITYENVLSEACPTNGIASFPRCLDPPCPLWTGLVNGKDRKYK